MQDILENPDLLRCILAHHACFQHKKGTWNAVRAVIQLFSSCKALWEIYIDATTRVLQQLDGLTYQTVTRRGKHLEQLDFLNEHSSIWTQLLKYQWSQTPAEWSLLFRHDTPLLHMVCPHHHTIIHKHVVPLPHSFSCGANCPGFVICPSSNIKKNTLICDFYWWCHHEKQHIRRVQQFQPSVKPKRPRIDYSLRTNGLEKRRCMMDTPIIHHTSVA